VARKKVDEAYSRTVEYYKQHGERGIAERIRAELDQAEAYVRRIANRNQILLAKD
jgi:hypothetical protein